MWYVNGTTGYIEQATDGTFILTMWYVNTDLDSLKKQINFLLY